MNTTAPVRTRGTIPANTTQEKTMAAYISSVRDLETLFAQGPYSDAQSARIARAIWNRDDFPHPVNHTDISDYLETIPDQWIWEQAGDE